MSARSYCSVGVAILFGLGGIVNLMAEESPKDREIIQFGTMHEAIGKQQHQGRVHLNELVKRDHFYGVAALEGLHGEVTIFDGKVTITGVREDGHIGPVAGSISDKQATMLVGAYVPTWTRIPVTRNIEADDFDAFVEQAATKAGIKTTAPFMFAVEGEFADVRLHVINGACPLHARLKNTELPEENRPFESEMSEETGTLVGVFAQNAVGKLTHPATSIHVHLLYKDKQTGADVTAHVEQVGLRPGAVLLLSK